MTDTKLARKLESVQRCRRARLYWANHEMSHKLQFMSMAQAEGWSWKRIGDALGVSDVAAQRYFDRNFKGGNGVRRRGNRRGDGAAVGNGVAAGASAMATMARGGEEAGLRQDRST